MTNAPKSAGYPEFRGHRWLLGRALIAPVWSFACGLGFGLFNGVGIFLGHGSTLLSYDAAWFMPLAAFFGAFVGVVTSPAMIGITTSREPRRGLKAVFWLTSLAAFVSGLALKDISPNRHIVVTGMCYIAVCIGWRLWNGSGAYAPRPGRCSKCGYELAGLTGECCPECGEAIVTGGPAS